MTIIEEMMNIKDKRKNQKRQTECECSAEKVNAKEAMPLPKNQK